MTPTQWSMLLASLALTLTACGGSSGTTSSAVKPSLTASRTTAPTSTTAATSHSTSRASSSAVHTTTAPAPVPPSTPHAPAGLRQTTGYGTYELCSAPCSGAVPASLRRPLHLARAASGSCPTGSSGGPVSAIGASEIRLTPFIASSWAGARVTWRASRSYRGPVLIRGRRVDGGGAVGFGEGHTPYDELQLLSSGQGAPSQGGSREWFTFTRVRGPGCYAYQVDGSSFSETIVFAAR